MKSLLTLLFLLTALISNAQTVSISSPVPSNTFCSGTNVTFTASTTGITNPTYQWYKNSVAISGETNSTYSTNALSNGDQIYVSVPTTVSGSLITSGLKFNFDAGNSSSYSGSETALNDLSGNGTHAAFQNAPTFVSSPIKTFQWNTRGSNGSNTTKASFSNVLGDDMTVGAWIKTSNSGNDLAHYRLLYILTGEQGGGANDWGFGINRLGKLAFGAGTNDVTISSTTSVNTNEWTYVVATRAKSTGQIKLYINGAFDNSGTGNAGNTLNAQSSILIADGNDGPAYTFEGNISIIEGYNTVLSADDVLANFNANKGRFGISSNLNSNTITASITNLSAPVTITGDGCVNKTTLSTTSGLSSYAWYKDNAPISGATSNTYSPTTAGDYKVQVTSGSCSTMSATTTISVCGVTADGRMSIFSSSTTLVSREGEINNRKGVDERGLILTNSVTPITTGLMLYLDATKSASYGGSGTTWNDISGQLPAGSATLVGNPPFSSGSFTFGDNMNASTSKTYTIDSEISLIAWVNPSQIQSAFTGVIFRRTSYDGGGTGMFISGNNLHYDWDNQHWSWRSDLLVPNDQWSMIVITVKDRIVTAYLCNASGINSISNDRGHGSLTSRGATNFHIGLDPYPGRQFKGKMGTAMVYSVGLSTDDITTIFNSQKAAFGIN
jgi:hypothetical protein